MAAHTTPATTRVHVSAVDKGDGRRRWRVLPLGGSVGAAGWSVTPRVAKVAECTRRVVAAHTFL